MQFLISTLVFFAVISHTLAATSCDQFTSQKKCLSGSVNNEKCAWCSSAAVGATCFAESDAKTLPSSIYSCAYQSAYSAEAVTSCDQYTSEKTCLAGVVNNEKCSWCSSAAVGATCFPESDAKSLPSSVFQCDYQKLTLKSTACDSITSQKTCMSSSSGAEKCSWCSSAAVGGTCFVESDAKSLPSSVFQCDYQKVALKSTTCDSITKQKTCLSSKSSDGVNCAWCSSGAVGSTCYEETDAKQLPSSIFSCQYQQAADYLRGQH
eukprot:gene550-592_t